MQKNAWLAACNTLASETRLRTTRLPPRSRPGRRCRNIETRLPRRRRRRRAMTLDILTPRSPTASGPCASSCPSSAPPTRSARSTCSSGACRACAGAFPSKRSEFTQNRKRNHPRPSFLETSHINKVKAPQHVKTRRSYRLPMYFPLISRKALAQSKGSIKDIKA